MDFKYERLLEALRCAAHGEHVQWQEPLSKQDQHAIFSLAAEHSVVPMLAEAVYCCPAALSGGYNTRILSIAARRLTVAQAQRTADLILVYQYLAERGLEPIVLKGIICRSLYPQPCQRPSIDEDLLIPKEAFAEYHKAMLAYGLEPFGEIDDRESADEAAYKSKDGSIYIELHSNPLPGDSKAYGSLNSVFTDSGKNTVIECINGCAFRTLSPTDHLLYLILHAYKHFLHGGFGIRMVLDIAIFADKKSNHIDFSRLLDTCRKLRIGKYSAALFKIGEKHLGFGFPDAFREYDCDEMPLLEDIMSGGLYGVEDINRAHSSTMTLNAVEASNKGKRRHCALHSVFLPAKSLEGRYTYLKKHRSLLPVAWVQRGFTYAFKKTNGKTAKPSESIRIGNERIALLRHYGIID
jgi:hypothetical protein